MGSYRSELEFYERAAQRMCSGEVDTMMPTDPSSQGVDLMDGITFSDFVHLFMMDAPMVSISEIKPLVPEPSAQKAAAKKTKQSSSSR